VLNAKLLSKIPKGSETPLPTRPKKLRFDKETEGVWGITAFRDHVGMADIVDYIGATS
jgi:hypothetical protein